MVFLDGELFWRQRASKFPMKDLAAQDIVAVSINYRTNVFGKTGNHSTANRSEE